MLRPTARPSPIQAGCGRAAAAVHARDRAPPASCSRTARAARTPAAARRAGTDGCRAPAHAAPKPVVASAEGDGDDAAKSQKRGS
jgi:hypothetical protein